MGPLTVGSVVMIHFPFSDLSSSKLRLALLLKKTTQILVALLNPEVA
ncbi:MAG: hypothetical protein VXB67_18100 [Deltaproteobacteria bacterium]